mgnify:CR=1 FL=1
MRPTLSPWAPHAPRIRHPYPGALGKYEPSPAVPIGDIAPFITGLFGPGATLAAQAGANAAAAGPAGVPSNLYERGSDGKLHLSAAGRASVTDIANKTLASVSASEIGGASIIGFRIDPSLEQVQRAKVLNAMGLYESTMAQRLSNLFRTAADEAVAAGAPDKAAISRAQSAVHAYDHVAGENAASQASRDVMTLSQYCPALGEGWQIVQAVEQGGLAQGGSAPIRQIVGTTIDTPAWFEEVKVWVKWGSLGAAVLVALVAANFLLPKG